jgi:hypothetical protein
MILSENCKLKIYNTSDESDKDTMKVETGETDGDTKERGDQDIQDLFDATITLKADEIYDIGGKAKSSEPTVLWRRNGRDIFARQDLTTAKENLQLLAQQLESASSSIVSFTITPEYRKARRKR